MVYPQPLLTELVCFFSGDNYIVEFLFLNTITKSHMVTHRLPITRMGLQSGRYLAGWFLAHSLLREFGWPSRWQPPSETACQWLAIWKKSLTMSAYSGLFAERPKNLRVAVLFLSSNNNANVYARSPFLVIPIGVARAGDDQPSDLAELLR